MNVLSTSQLNSVTKLVESMGEKIVFTANIEKQHKKKQKIEKRVAVITEYRFLTLRSGLMTGYRIAREGLIQELKTLSTDDSERITIELSDWSVTFHTLYTEQFVSTLINKYYAINALIPSDQRASIQVNKSNYTHYPISDEISQPDPQAVDRGTYMKSLMSMYRAMCNKYGTQPLEDVEQDIADRYENCCPDVVLDNARRTLDSQQCAAIIEMLRWDRWFTSLEVIDIVGVDVIIPALAITLGSNQTLRTVKVNNIKTNPKTLMCLADAFAVNSNCAVRELMLSRIVLSNELLETLIPILPPLEKLSFAHNNMNQTSMVHLFSLIKVNTTLSKSISSLDISFNSLGPDGTNAMASWLSESLPSKLVSLNLAGTNVAWSAAISILQKADLNVTDLDISSNAIYDKVFCLLNPFVAGGRLRRLTLGNMKGDITMVEGLCGSLLLNQKMSFTAINLDDTAMDYRIQERIISLVAQSTSLQELSLRNCEMDDMCISMLCDVIAKYAKNRVKKLCLDGNLRIPEVGKSSAFLAALMKQSTSLEELSISGCHGILVSKLAEGIKATTSLKVLNMNDCGLMDDEIKILCDSIIYSKCISTLRIDGNNIMKEGFVAVLEMLKTNTKLTDMGYLRSLPEIERLFEENDRETIKSCRRSSFIRLMKNQKVAN